MIGQIFQQLIGPIFNVIDQAVEDKDEAARIKAQIQAQVLQNEATMTSALRDIVVAEAQGQSYLQRNWRPILMLVFTCIVANNYILAPYLDAIFNWSVTLEPPEQLWQLLNIGVGGYIVGRSAEKITDSYVNRGDSGNGNAS